MFADIQGISISWRAYTGKRFKFQIRVVASGSIIDKNSVLE